MKKHLVPKRHRNISTFTCKTGVTTVTTALWQDGDDDSDDDEYYQDEDDKDWCQRCYLCEPIGRMVITQEEREESLPEVEAGASCTYLPYDSTRYTCRNRLDACHLETCKSAVLICVLCTVGELAYWEFAFSPS